MNGNWENAGSQTFMKLHENASVDEVNKKMSALVKKNCNDCFQIRFCSFIKTFICIQVSKTENRTVVLLNTSGFFPLLPFLFC